MYNALMIYVLIKIKFCRKKSFVKELQNFFCKMLRNFPRVISLAENSKKKKKGNKVKM